LKKLEQELNRLGTGDIWRRGGENSNNVCREVSKQCVDTECQKIEANMRDKMLFVLYNKFKNWLGNLKLHRILHI
jgi:hypothetical protein